MSASILVSSANSNSTYDAWGNIRNAPIKTIEESHNDNFVKVFVYEVGGLFHFGYQIKVGKTLRQKAANINDKPFSTKDLAGVCGCMEVETICRSNKNTLKLFLEFKKIAWAQLELFSQED